MNSQFHDWLRERMRETGKSQRCVSTRAGLSHSTISSLLRREGRPSLETALALAEYFEANADEVLRLAGYDVDRNGHASLGELARHYYLLSPEDRQVIDDLVKSLYTRRFGQ